MTVIDYDLTVKVPFNSAFHFWAPDKWADYLLDPHTTIVDVDTQHAIEFLQRTTNGKFPDLAFRDSNLLHRKSDVGFTDEICCLYFGGVEWKDMTVRRNGSDVVIPLTPRNFGLDFDDWDKV